MGYTLKSLGLRGNLNHQQPPEGVYGYDPTISRLAMANRASQQWDFNKALIDVE